MQQGQILGVGIPVADHDIQQRHVQEIHACFISCRPAMQQAGDLPEPRASVLLVFGSWQAPQGLRHIFLVNTRDSPLSVDHPVVAGHDQNGFRQRQNLGRWHRQAKLTSHGQTERFVGHHLGKAGIAALEEMGGRQTVDGQGPFPRCESRQDEFLLNASQRHPDLPIDPQRFDRECAHALLEVFGIQVHGARGAWSWRDLPLGKQHESPGTVSTEGTEESEGIVRGDPKIVRQHATGLAFRQQTLEERTGRGVSERPGSHR
jgi:hypothetical protein